MAYANIPKKTIEKAFELFDQGVSRQDIAAQIGVHKTTVGGWIRKGKREALRGRSKGRATQRRPSDLTTEIDRRIALMERELSALKQARKILEKA